jgi:hypothetical protein
MESEIVASELPSRHFKPHIYGVGAWTDNLHFAYDVVGSLQPRLLVELGTDRGESYFAFCQSIVENHTGTRCFAVDTWRGDQQAGGYDETTFHEVSTHHARHYSGFSTLLRCTFDEALERFAPESIDLLHLDGLHTEEAVRHDVESWLPKIRPGGILLMHDISVRAREFGVWKVWEELQRRGASFAFTDGPGLGVWQKPPATRLPEPLRTLLGESSDSAATVAQYYRGRAGEIQAKIGEQWRDGSIRETAAGNQTAIQVFHTRDGTHREEESAFARVGHGEWKDVSILLPPGAGAAPLRIDFLSAFTIIDIASISLTSPGQTHFRAEGSDDFAAVAVAGDAERREHPSYLRIAITGVDPQLHLPPVEIPSDVADLRVAMRLRVSAGEPPGESSG